MQIQREEVRTGVLVVVTIAILTGVLIAIGAPGIFWSTNTYNIYFDNAAGLNQGASVLLAGRRIGQVTNLISPVPMDQRPKGHENCEALVQVQVDRSAKVYNKVQVHMLQTSLLGSPIIDFTNGDQSSGLAPDGSYWVGVREPDFTQSIAQAVQVLKDTVTPVAADAENTMKELSSTADNLKKLTAPGSDVDQAVIQFKKFADNLVDISAKGNSLQSSLANIRVLTGTNGHLSMALANADRLTQQLIAEDRVEKTLSNLQSTTEDLDSLISQITPGVNSTVSNLDQATDTLKRQPWRLVWPSTKRYPSPTPAHGGM
jgi:ABC-type transporter Mla subunit MlaD